MNNIMRNANLKLRFNWQKRVETHEVSPWQKTSPQDNAIDMTIFESPYLVAVL